MNPYLKVSGLDATTCAGLLGYSPRLFQEWTAGQRPIPPSIAAHLSSVLGVETSDLLAPGRQPLDETEIEPAIWFKLRSAGLGSADRELVLLIRQLGTFYEELEQVFFQESTKWKLVFEEIRRQIDIQAPPREQGRLAAQLFRKLQGWNQGKAGIGELLRSTLRQNGILLVESPINDSTIEGCAFPVGASRRPCVFANGHNTTWFRRNAVILHELAHLIFDMDSGAALDVFDRTSPADEIPERRAEAFAQEAALPLEVLRHLAQRHGISWASGLSATDLANIVAESHVEIRLVIRVALEHGLLEPTQAHEALQLQILDHLKPLSSHALTTTEFLEAVGEKSAAWLSKRSTSTSPRTIMLPVNYVTSVVEACMERVISISRAARLLMISEDLFAERFNISALSGTE
jgi:Zn-dependent peptidase ImmA (M78 family)